MNKSRAEQAVTNFIDTDLNCSQAVFSTYAELLGLDAATAMKITDPFGGGISGTAQTCGAVTGALMTIGLKYGFSLGNDIEKKKQTRSLSKKFLELFNERHGSTNCFGLLPVSINTEAGMTEAKENDYFKTKCPNFVRDAVEILEHILESN